MPAARQPSGSARAPNARSWTVVVAGALLIALAAARFARTEPVAAPVIVAMAAVVTVVLHRKRVDPLIVGILLGGLALDVFYASYTSWIERNPDANSHVLYMRYLLDFHRLPSATDCSVCHHPPLYYVAAATVLATCERSRAIEPSVGLQLFSLALFVTFLASAALLVQRFLHRRLDRAVAMLLVACWPYGVIQSVRVNNDALVCAIAGLVLLFLSDFHRRSTARSLWIACALVVVGLFTKASALSLVAVVLLVVARKVFSSLDRKKALRSVAPALAALLTVCALQGAFRGSGGSVPENVLGTAYKTRPSELVPRTARYYLTFEPRDFVERPFVVARMFRTDEPTYWNQLLKSSLFGVRNAPIFAFLRPEPGPNPRLGSAANATLLVLALLTAVGLRRPSPARAFCLQSVLALVSGGLAFHLLVPYGFHADFRFVFPVLVPLSILFAAARRRRSVVRPAVAVAFAALSVAAFVPTTWTSPPVRSTAPLPSTVVRR